MTQEPWELYGAAAQPAAPAAENGDPNEPWLQFNPPAKTTGELDRTVGANVEKLWTPDQAKIATNPIEMLAAGFDMSVAGLMQHAPRTVMPQHAGLMGSILAGAGQIGGDLIPGLVGGAIGTPTGAAVGGAAGSVVPIVGTGAGAAVGGVIGAGAGFAALPEGMRQVLMDHYTKGELHTWDEFVSRSAEIAYHTGTAAVIGGAGAFVGGAVGAKAMKLTGSASVAAIANATGFATAATTAGAAMEGRIPNAEDFSAAAILALGFHVASATVGGVTVTMADGRVGTVAARMRNLYAKTGIPPWEQVARAKADPAMRQEIYGEDVNGDPVTPGFRASKPQEPEPYIQDAEFTDKGPAAKALPNPEPHPELKDLIAYTENSAGYAKRHGINEADVISSAGAIGKFQIMPDTARQYMGKGFDVATLRDPAVNEKVANKIIADLQNRFRNEDGSVDTTAVLIAYNAGPGRANSFIRNGRKFSSLPVETQRYLERADTHGMSMDLGPLRRPEEASGGGGGGKPPAERPSGPGASPGGELGPLKTAAQKTPEELEADVLGIIGVPENESLMEQMKGLANSSYDRYLSEMGPAKRLDIQLGLGKDGQIDTEDMFRSTYASGERAGHFIKYGALDPFTFERVETNPRARIGGNGGPPLEPETYMGAYEMARDAGGTERGFTAYRLAKRTIDLAERGIKTRIPLEEASALVQAKAGVYEKADLSINRLKNSVLDYGRKSGLYSLESVDRIKAKNPSHIPFKQAVEKGSLKVGGKSRGFQSRQTLQKMKGGDREIIEPVYADLENIHTLIRMSDRNNAIGFLVDPGRVTAEKGITHLQEEIITALGFKPSDVGKVGFQSKYEVALFEAIGIRPALEQPPELLKSWDFDAEFTDVIATREGFSRGSKFGDDTFVYFRNGVGELWKANDPAVAAMIRGSNPTDIGTLQGLIRWSATLQRTGITAMPDYMLKAVFRDQFTVPALYKGAGLPFQNLLAGMPEVFGGTELFKEFLRTGGMGSALADMDLKYIQRDVNAVFDKTGVWTSVANAVKDPIETARYVMERMDAMSRVGSYKRGKQALLASTGATGPSLKLAMGARTGYIDFAERGTSQLLNSWSGMVPFLRPALLGLEQLASRVVADPFGVMLRASRDIAIPAVALWLLNWIADKELPDGSKYSDIARWQRDMFFITPPIGGVRWRFPKPRELGLVFGSLFERMLDHTVSHDPEALKGFAQTFFTTFLPPSIFAATVPVLENITNHSMFTGRPLIPASLEDASNYMQYTAGTSETAIALAKVLGPPQTPLEKALGVNVNVTDVSPIVIQNYVRQWTGSVGSAALGILDARLEKPGHVKELADNIFVKSFVIRHNDMGAAPIEDFYDGVGELRAKHRDLALAIDRNDPGELDFTSKDVQAFADVAEITDAIRNHQSAIKAINESQDMKMDEKRQRIDSLYSSIVTMAKSGNTIMRTLKAAPKPEVNVPGDILPGAAP